jgi:hypothetical protein
MNETGWRAFAASFLYVFIQIDAHKHPDDAEEVDLGEKAKGELNEDQIDGQWLGDTKGIAGGEDRLNCAMRGHDPENFSQYSTQ